MSLLGSIGSGIAVLVSGLYLETSERST